MGLENETVVRSAIFIKSHSALKSFSIGWVARSRIEIVDRMIERTGGRRLLRARMVDWLVGLIDLDTLHPHMIVIPRERETIHGEDRRHYTAQARTVG